MKPEYDCNNTDFPYLDVVDADVFEPVEAWLGKRYMIADLVAVALLKIKLLVDLKTLKNAQEIQSKAPPEIADEIIECVRKNCQSKIISETPASKLKPELDNTIKSLEQQIATLVHATHKANPHYWKALVNCDPNASLRPHTYSAQSPEEATMILAYSYAAWRETNEALTVIQKFLDTNGVPITQVVSL